MSSDVMQMFRSDEIVLAEFREKYPQFGSDLNAHLLDTINGLAVRALIQGRPSAAWYLSKKLVVLEPRTAISRLPHTVDVCCRGLVPRWIKVRVNRMRNAESRPLYEKIYLER